MTPLLSALTGARSFGTLANRGGRFAALQIDTSISLYSNGGYTWSSSTAPLGEYYYITYGDGKFISVSGSAGSNSVIYSLDSVTWSTAALPSSGNWFCSAFGSGTFVALGNGLNKAAYSTNGTSWTGTSIANQDWGAVTYGSNKFVVVSKTGSSNIYATSSNGITWTTSTLPISGRFEAVVYGSNGFVTVNSSNFNGAISQDGISWNIITMPTTTSGGWYLLTYGNMTYLASNGFDIATSIDGINWTIRTSPLTGISQITFGNGIFAMCSYNTGTQNIAISKDGISWTLISHANTQFLSAIGFGQ